MTREEIRAQAKQHAESQEVLREEISFPGVAEKLYVRDMAGATRDQFDQYVDSVRRNGIVENVRALLLVHCIVNEQNQKVFDLKDALWIGEMPSSQIIPLYRKAKKVNAIGEEEIKEQEGNSSTGQEGPDGSDSQDNSDAQ